MFRPRDNRDQRLLDSTLSVTPEPSIRWVVDVSGNRDLMRVAVARDPIQAVPIWETFAGVQSDSLDLSVNVHISGESGEPSPTASTYRSISNEAP